MLPKPSNYVFAFDAEWVPDTNLVSVLRPELKLKNKTKEATLMQYMWEYGGATPENPRPYLKPILCKIVSISGILRKVGTAGVSVELISLPTKVTATEKDILIAIQKSINHHKPQLVGYNSGRADLPAIIGRSIGLGINVGDWTVRPAKPWEGCDYFGYQSNMHIDLSKVYVGLSNATIPSLNEAAAVCGFPGKGVTHGSDVADLYLKGDLQSIINYNECDAVITYLLWLKACYYQGYFNQEQYSMELDCLKSELLRKSSNTQLTPYIEYLT